MDPNCKICGVELDYHDVDENVTRICKLMTRNRALENGLKYALEQWEYSAQYKGDHLMAKHDDKSEIMRLRALLEGNR